ncbi:sensory transduction histidine kinase [Oscillochloris trichoides DG-6]|uniref:histidine kinase n=1 Tax=Oscillochloris trichoides DG-6 TaxID=765420 RepID=E1I9N5_9CHLR|nr:ATP-binding protein [Oscillochloris trichoides]EFO82113.1 sensory transduction histidine kinase [Oscillochloris trichoides DG-6]
MSTFQANDDLGHEERSLRERLAAVEAQLAAYQQAANLMEAWKDAAGPQLLTILNNFASGILLISVDGRFLFVNPRAAAMFDLHPEEMIGRYVEEILPPEIAQVYQERTRELFALQITHEYERSFTLPLSERTLFISNQILATSQGDALLSSLVDISTRTRVEAELRVALTKYRTLFDAMPLGITVSDHTGQIVESNAMAERLLGIGKEEHHHRQIDGVEWRIVRPDGSTMPPEEFASVRALKEHRLIENVEMGIVTPDGITTWINVTAAPLPLEDYGVVIAYNDISSRMAAEQALHQTMKELTRSNADLEQFAYVASHDLQEPLRGVIGMLQLLHERYQGRLDSRADQYIALAIDSANRMQALINDLLLFSRVERRNQIFTQMDAAAALEHAMANLQVVIQESGAEITYDPLPQIYADSTQITQLFQNLLSNAIKFRDEAPPRIHISAQRRSNAWVFAVRDNGIGIAPDHVERIFIIFQRLHPRQAYPGTGIGLAICKKIVERHGGQIWVNSHLGHGATFFFTIPDQA